MRYMYTNGTSNYLMLLSCSCNPHPPGALVEAETNSKNGFNLCSVPKHFPQYPLVCEQVKKSMFSVLTSLRMLSSMKECCIKKQQNRKNKRISSIKPDIFMRMII